MQQAQTDDLQRQLMALREELSESDPVATDAGRTVVLDQSSVGRLSRMDALQGQAMAQATERRKQVQLRRVEAALARIAAGDYGFCQTCDEPIAPRRLAVDPTATLCIGCASTSER